MSGEMYSFSRIVFGAQSRRKQTYVLELPFWNSTETRNIANGDIIFWNSDPPIPQQGAVRVRRREKRENIDGSEGYFRTRARRPASTDMKASCCLFEQHAWMVVVWPRHDNAVSTEQHSCISVTNYRHACFSVQLRASKAQRHMKLYQSFFWTRVQRNARFGNMKSITEYLSSGKRQVPKTCDTFGRIFLLDMTTICIGVVERRNKVEGLRNLYLRDTVTLTGA